MKPIESWTFRCESFTTVTCFIHHKHVVARRSLILQCGHWETDLKTPWWAGKWLIPTAHPSSRGAQEPNRQLRYELIPGKTEHMSPTNAPDAWLSSPPQTKQNKTTESQTFERRRSVSVRGMQISHLPSVALNRLFGSGSTLDEWLRFSNPNHPLANPWQRVEEVMC